MGGIFGVVGKNDCVMDLFFGVDYHSHLGTRRGGMAVFDGEYFNRVIHNIENSPFRTKFERDVDDLHGPMGIGCISDEDPQPLLIQSSLGSYAITTVGKVDNHDDIVNKLYKEGKVHFQEQSGGRINDNELIATLISSKQSFKEGLEYVQDTVKGSISVVLLTKEGIYAARDKFGRTPLVIGNKKDTFCITFENHAYLNLGYSFYKELGPSEIVFITADEVKEVSPAKEEMKICSFLWVYYGYPTASYEGVNVETMRYNCGKLLARRDDIDADIVAGGPDSGTAHSGNDILLIDDSIVRGTQLRETTEFLYNSGAKKVHVRPACPPLLFGCKYLNFSRSKSDYDLITRRIIREREGENVSKEVLYDYADPDSKNYNEMVEEIRKIQNLLFM